MSAYHLLYGLARSRVHGFVDFPIFARQAAAYLETGSLYPDADHPEAYKPSAEVYKYPPFYATWLLPFVRDGIPDGLYTGHWWLLVLLQTATVTAAVRLLRGPRPGLVGAAIVLLAVNYEPFAEALWHLQAEIPFLALFVLSLWALGRGRDALAGAAIGLGAGLKIFPGFLLLYFLVRRRFRAAASCVITGVGTVAFSLLFIDLDAHVTFFTRILPVMLQENPSLHVQNLSLGRPLQEIAGFGPLAARRTGQAVAVALLGLSIFAVRRPRAAERSGNREALRLSLFVALMLLAMPNCWSHYQVMLLLPFFSLAAWTGGAAAGARRTCVLVLASTAYFLTLWSTPCADPSYPYPCAQTPYFLGLFQFPRPLHDAMVYLKGAANLLVWGAAFAALAPFRRR